MSERPASGSPQDWLHNARSDLLLAQTRRRRGILYAHLCFHAEQAAEKSLKAVLVALGVSFPKTHDLAFLIDRFPPTITLPTELIDLPKLTKYAVQQRYPGEAIPVTRADHRQAVHQAEEAVAWATHRVIRHRRSRGPGRR